MRKKFRKLVTIHQSYRSDRDRYRRGNQIAAGGPAQLLTKAYVPTKKFHFYKLIACEDDTRQRQIYMCRQIISMLFNCFFFLNYIVVWVWMNWNTLISYPFTRVLWNSEAAVEGLLRGLLVVMLIIGSFIETGKGPTSLRRALKGFVWQKWARLATIVEDSFTTDSASPVHKILNVLKSVCSRWRSNVD